MPVFDYRCKKCNTVFDIFHKGKEIIEDIICPKCGATEYIKLMSAPSISFSGAASTDFSSGSSCETGCCGGSCGLN